MDGKIVIEFSRNKEESKKIFFKYSYKRELYTSILRGISIYPILIAFTFLLSPAILISLNQNDSWQTPLFVFLILLYTFLLASRIIKIYKYQLQLINEVFKNFNEIKFVLEIDQSGFTYSSDIFTHTTLWSNTRMLKFDSMYCTFQCKMPNLQFFIPVHILSNEAKTLLKSKIRY